jgi:hypothetical protein
MFRTVLMTFFVVLAASTTIQAQQSADPALARTACNCPDIDVVLLFDQNIAELEAKLTDVRAGRFEDISGYPNNAGELQRLITSYQGLRTLYLRDIAACQRICRLYPDQDATSGLSAFTGATSACPQCAAAADQLSQAEIRLANRLTEIERFRELNRIRERDGVASSDFQARRASADRARAAYEVERRRHQALVDRAEALKLAATSEEVFAEAAGRNGQLDPSEIPGFVGGQFVNTLATAADFFLTAARLEGLPIPDETGLSRLGEAFAAERLAERYHREHVEPARRAWDSARLYLPDEDRYLHVSYGISTFTWQEGSVIDQLAEYESGLLPLIAARDTALEALIDCNLNQCRPVPDVSDMFGPGGAYEGQTPTPAPEPLPDDGLGLAPEAPILPSSDPGPGAEASAATGQGAGADGLGLIDIDVPETGVPPEVQALLDQLEASGTRPTAGPCEYEPEAICRKLDPQDEPQCLTSVGRVRDQCLDYQRRAFTELGREASCRLSCEYSQESINLEFWLRDRTLVWLDQNYNGLSNDAASDRADRQARLAQLESEISELEAARDRRGVHIYRHGVAGTLIQHAGAYFDPRPPLTYVGEAGGAFTQAELGQWNALSREREQLMVLLQSPGDAALDDWYAGARESWLGGPRWPAPMACFANEVAGEYQACLAQCAAEGDSAGPQSICQPSSIIGRLNTPGSTRQIYPPDDPRREP